MEEHANEKKDPRNFNKYVRINPKYDEYYRDLWAEDESIATRLIYNEMYGTLLYMWNIIMLLDTSQPSKVRYAANNLLLGKNDLDINSEYIHRFRENFDDRELPGILYYALHRVLRYYFLKRKPKSTIGGYITKYILFELRDFVRGEYNRTERNKTEDLFEDPEGYTESDFNSVYILLPGYLETEYGVSVKTQKDRYELYKISSSASDQQHARKILNTLSFKTLER